MPGVNGGNRYPQPLHNCTASTNFSMMFSKQESFLTATAAIVLGD